MSVTRLPAALAASALLLTACGGGADDAPAASEVLAACPDTLRFADTQVEALEELGRRYEPFRDALQDATGSRIEFFASADRLAASTALEFDQVDMVLTGPAEYVVINATAGALPVVGLTRPDYFSLIGVHADSDIQELDDLRGRTVAVGRVGSTSRQLGPTAILVDEAGFEPGVDVDILQLGDAWREAFIAGEVDAIGAGRRHFDDVVEALGEDQVRVLHEGPPLPNDLFVAREGLGQECVDQLQGAFLDNSDALLAAIWDTADGTDNEKYLDSEFVRAQDADYEPIRAAFRAVGIDDFSTAEVD